jgi:3-isopropylmalate/(R)-2-methylmalate dehydratase large subunit
MGNTIIEKILLHHGAAAARPGDIVDLIVDLRLARDFGGANVVNNLTACDLDIADPTRTYFTFDCNPGGSDQKYAANQHQCRTFARDRGIGVYDIDAGIGTHIAIDQGLILPGGTLVSTDSHANLVGAVNAFGQGMGDIDIAYAFAHGSVWFEVPETVKIVLKGSPGPDALAKDIVLAMLKAFGAHGLLGCAAEVYGAAAETMDLSGRITISSMATEMGAISILFPASNDIVDLFQKYNRTFTPCFADSDARYLNTVEVDIDALEPMIARPGHPEDVVPVSSVRGTRIDSVFIGSCTNGRFEDMKAAAGILKGKKVAPGVVLKIVPATDRIWKPCLDAGILHIFKESGALIGNAGCAGCAAGQIGQNGPGEVTVSTGNRNFAGKQGKGEVYLASPATAAASAISGVITTGDDISAPRVRSVQQAERHTRTQTAASSKKRPTRVKGRIWVIEQDNIDTDMIFHNRHLSVTDIRQMGQFAFGNLPGWEDFATKAQPGDIVVTGENFGCGSSRQQAVDCFTSLGIALIVARSFGAIYKRNAINSGLAILSADLRGCGIADGDELDVDLATGEILCVKTGQRMRGTAFSSIQMDIYQRRGLLGQPHHQT